MRSPPVINSIALPAGLVFTLFFVYFTWAALTFPSVFNPDDQANAAATDYLVETRRLPVVDAQTPGIQFSDLGTTRSLRPPLTFITAAVSDVLSQPWKPGENRGQRIGAAFLGALTVSLALLGFYLAFKSWPLALLGALSLGLLPRFLILSSTNNDDIGAMLSVTALFSGFIYLFTQLASPSKDSSKALLCVFFAIGLVFQTKFTAWVALPFALSFATLLCVQHRGLIKSTPIWFFVMAGFVLILAGGWWPLFNMFHYGITDPTALNHAIFLQEHLSDDNANRRGFSSMGWSLLAVVFNWNVVWKPGMAGLLGDIHWLSIVQPLSIKLFYGFIGVVAIVNAVLLTRKSCSLRLLGVFACVLILGQAAVFAHHLWLRDVQLDGRYLMPMAMPLVFLCLQGLNRLPAQAIKIEVNKKHLNASTVIALPMIGLLCWLHYQSVAERYVASFTQTSLTTRLQTRHMLDLDQIFSKATSSRAASSFVAPSSLTISRTDFGEAYLESSQLCRFLAINSVLMLDITSISPGAIGLAVIDENQTVLDQNWQAIQAGKNTVLLSANKQGCARVRFYLGKQTQKVSLTSMHIYELRTHGFGEPIL